VESSFREGGGFRWPGPKKLFTQEFRDEAVRLAQTSGRSRREVAADLGIGLSTLRNWIDRRRERQMDEPPSDRQEDMAAELKRLRRRTRCCARSARS
jgi:transposase